MNSWVSLCAWLRSTSSSARAALDQPGQFAGRLGQADIVLLKAADLGRERGVPTSQTAVNQIFLGVMNRIRIFQTVSQNGADHVVIRVIAGGEQGELPLEKIQQPREVGMLPVEPIQHFRHWFRLSNHEFSG